MSSSVNSFFDSLRPYVESVWETLRNPSVTNQPPTAAEQRRNDRNTLIVIAAAILLGWMIANGARNAVDEYEFEGGLPSVVVPEGWITTQSDGEGELLFSASDPASASIFESSVEVYARALNEGEDLTMLNVSWPLQRSQQLERFRTLSSEVVRGPDGEDALLITYAYVADPTRESGTLGLPVVVRGQDLVFITGEEGAREVVVVSTAADAATWDSAAGAFHRLYDHLGVQEQ